MSTILSLLLPNPTTPLSLPPRRRHHHLLRPISAASRPPRPPPPPSTPYQPFRRPPSPLPSKYRSLSPTDRLDILRNRLGQWHEYAPLISSLAADGFTPPSVEEVTGLTSIEQNRLVVATQVRSSLTIPPSTLAFFDSEGGADLLYELRILNFAQRSAAARRVAELNLNPKSVQELAKSIRDFPKRRGEHGWEHFDPSDPDDCLAFTYYRLALEAISPEDRVPALEKAMQTACSDTAKRFIATALDKATGKGDLQDEEEVVKVTVPVVRLQYGEVAEATTVALLPVCDPTEEDLAKVPGWCRVEGGMGVVKAEKGWGRWVVLPGWGMVVEAAKGGGVAVEYTDARALPWRVNRWAREEEVVVVADRERREVVDDDGFYLAAGEKGELVVERGSKLSGKEALATVVMVVRPPKEDEEEQLGDEEWV